MIIAAAGVGIRGHVEDRVVGERRPHGTQYAGRAGVPVAGAERTFAIAGCYRIHDGRTASAKIYREGRAEVR